MTDQQTNILKTPEPKVIANGSRELHITPDRYGTMVNILVEDTYENVYRGINVHRNALINALFEAGVLDELLDQIKETYLEVLQESFNKVT